MAPAPRIAVPTAIDAAALRNFDSTAPLCMISGQTMGTTWQVQAALPASANITAADLQARIDARLDVIVREMSHWQADSDLSRYNNAAAQSAVALPPDFATVMACALDIARHSDGAFDPAQGRLTDIWGLGPRPATGEPDDTAIAEALRLSGWHKLAFAPDTAMLHQPGGLWLDLSGIAKGYAADAVADLLGRLGLGHALVNIGGECAGRGMRPDGDPWWVDLECPPGLALAPLRVALHQLSVATSGDYLRGAHTLDPRSGRPAIHATTVVSVIHQRCMEADAWATALSVVALPDAQMLAIRHDLAARIVLRSGAEWLSPALRAML